MPRKLATKSKSKKAAHSTPEFKTTLSPSEEHAIENLAKEKKLSPYVKDGDVRVCYTRQDNFTIATVVSNGNLLVGTAKRNTHDKTSDVTGKMFAFTRALKSIHAISITKLTDE